jgi:hypothetical protein
MSYECEICECISCPGYDGSLKELGFHMCTHGHIICDQCWDHVTVYVDDSGSDTDEDCPDETDCPLCNFMDISAKEIIEACLKVMDLKKMKKILLSSFNNKDDFNNWLSHGNSHRLQEKLRECLK